MNVKTEGPDRQKLYGTISERSPQLSFCFQFCLEGED